MTETITQPKSPIPAPLRGMDRIGSFTYDSIAERLPEIGRRTLDENDFPPDVAARLEALFDGLPKAPVPPIQHRESPGAEDWARYLEPFAGQNWLEIPWFTIETYFYRLILDITGYFQPDSPLYHYDPFQNQKMQGLESGRELIRRMCEQAGELAREPEETALQDLLMLNLWGNQADLSMWPAGGQGAPGHKDDSQRDSHLVVDDTGEISRHLLAYADLPVRIDFLIDNAGVELVADLFLTDYLLARLPQSQVQYHVKDHPTFVSDVMAKDVRATLDFLAEMEAEQIRSLGTRLHKSLDDGRLALRADPFWTSPLAGWEMPAELRRELAQAGIVISKGDAHYRRLLGDRHWPYTTPLANVWRYLPAPLAALRVCKSEIAAGIPPGKAETLSELEPDWLYNGKWAVIQFYNPGI